MICNLFLQVVYVSCDACDLVILDPSWLCCTILGYLLCQESLDRARVTGIYSADDVQLVFPEADGPQLLLVWFQNCFYIGGIKNIL